MSRGVHNLQSARAFGASDNQVPCEKENQPDKEKCARGLEGGFTYPGGLSEVTSVCFIENGNLSYAITEKSLASNLVNSKEFDLSFDIWHCRDSETCVS